VRKEEYEAVVYTVYTRGEKEQDQKTDSRRTFLDFVRKKAK